MTQLRLDIEEPRPDAPRPAAGPIPRPSSIADPGGARALHRLPRLSIGASLAVMVATCLVPSLVALGLLIRADYRAQRDALLDEAAMRARTAMLLVDSECDAVEAGLRVLAGWSDLAGNDAGRLRDRLRNAAKAQDVDGYVIVDRDGRTRLDTRRDPRVPADIASRMGPLFATGQRVLAVVFPAVADPVPIVVLGVPLARNAEVVHALAVTIAPERIVASAFASIPDGWVASVLDDGGRVVARMRDEGLSSKDSATTISASSRSSKTRWTVAVEAPTARLTSALVRSIGWLVGGAVVALALVVWLAFVLSRAVTRAVGSLVEPALALGSGAAGEQKATPFRETAAVGRAIRQASGMLATAQHHAYHDPLTGLRNRTLFDEMATRQIAQAYRDGAQLAILAIDLDGFKAVNDLHGHAAGDAVLRTVAARVTGLLRASDVVSRRGGDEFSALLVDVDGVKTRHIAEKLLAALSEPYPDVVPSVSASIGVARYPRDATTLPELLERADEALYAAKAAGKRRVVVDF